MHLITADKMQRGEYTMIKIKWHQENEPRMHVNTREGVTYLTYPEFDRLPGFVHAFSTRLGGVSEGIYSSMNSGAPRDRTFSFRMERNGGKDRGGHSSKDAGRIRL